MAVQYKSRSIGDDCLQDYDRVSGRNRRRSARNGTFNSLNRRSSSLFDYLGRLFVISVDIEA